MDRGHPIDIPPYFDGNDYAYWKERMRIYILATDYDMWTVIEKGAFRPISTRNGTTVEKGEEELTEADKRNLRTNYSAIQMIYSAVRPEELMHIHGKRSAKEMWDLLEAIHEGTHLKGTALKNTWDETDSESSGSEVEESTDICLMAHGNEVSSLHVSSDSEGEQKDLLEAFDELASNFKLLKKKYKKLITEHGKLIKKHESLVSEVRELEEAHDRDMDNQIKNQNSLAKIMNNNWYKSEERERLLSNEIKILRIKNKQQDNIILGFNKHSKMLQDKHEKEIVELKKENKDLAETILKFTKGSENLKKLLGSQKVSFDKAGLGYEGFNRKKEYKNFFVKSTTCYACNEPGHKSNECLVRFARDKSIGKLQWVPKGTRTNPRTHQVWVPKSR